MNFSEFLYTVILKPPLLRRVANACLRSILPRSVNVQGAKIHLNPKDPVVSGALTLGVYERDEISFFCDQFEPNSNFVDVGANVGLYTGLALSRPNFHGKILCIEPDSESRQFLAATIQSNQPADFMGSVQIEALAASDVDGRVTLFKNPDNKGDNRIYSDPLCSTEQAIPCTTLDLLCKSAEFSEINFLKVDVQGAEGKVFQGASKILAASRDCIIMTEFWPYGLTRCGTSPEGYLIQLKSLGFSLFELDSKKLTLISNPADIIKRSSGRVYRNLIGLKGRYLEKLTR